MYLVAGPAAQWALVAGTAALGLVLVSPAAGDEGRPGSAERALRLNRSRRMRRWPEDPLLPGT